MTNTKELQTLHTAVIDARNGYDEAIKDAEAAELKLMFEKVRRVHSLAHQDIHKLLVDRGLTPDEGGSFMTTVHEVVIGVRAAVIGLGPDSLPAFANGEEDTLRKYDNAMSADPSSAATLRPHRAALDGAMAEMRTMAEGR